MAQTDPVYITFEFRGDIDKEVNKVTLGIKGLRDEAATTYNKLIADSSAAYNAMSAESRKLATTMQGEYQQSAFAFRDAGTAGPGA